MSGHSRRGSGVYTPSAAGVPIDGMAEAMAHRRLWCAIASASLHEAVTARLRELNPNLSRPRRPTAWIGTRDFRIVMTHAGLDPETVEDHLRAAWNDSEALRRLRARLGVRGGQGARPPVGGGGAAE